MATHHGPRRLADARELRLRRLRRTLVVGGALLLSLGLVAVMLRPDSAVVGSAGAVSANAGAAPRSQPLAGVQPSVQPGVQPSSVQPSTGSAARDQLPPVVTDAIPSPTKTFSLSAAVPGTTNMQPVAAQAFRQALAAARRAGHQPQIRSAWRSERFQQVLFDRAVAKYGSVRAASRWVLPPARSAHVKGYAVDVHPRSAARWLQTHGMAYGVCRVYDNEWWHFEYVASTDCPPLLPHAGG